MTMTAIYYGNSARLRWLNWVVMFAIIAAGVFAASSIRDRGDAKRDAAISATRARADSADVRSLARDSVLTKAYLHVAALVNDALNDALNGANRFESVHRDLAKARHIVDSLRREMEHTVYREIRIEER